MIESLERGVKAPPGKASHKPVPEPGIALEIGQVTN
jgi:hypothetical protein